ncbi:MAG: glycosyl transferase [Paracoccaceae bacterium]|nr:glycosyl transferase [Paracoccaceae bacterium]
MSELNVICIRWGTLFGPEYVNRLYKAIKRNSRRDVRFFCMTDDRSGFDPDVEVLDLVEEPFHAKMMALLPKTARRGPMRKVSMFNPELIQDLNGPLIALDLDVVVTGSLDDLADYAPGKVCMRPVWTTPSRMVGVGHGSVLKFEPARHSYLYGNILADPEAEILKANGSEQSYTSYAAYDAGDFEPFPSEWIVSFKYDCRPPRPLNLVLRPKLPEDARVVCFHGRPKMHEAVEGYKGDPLHRTRRVDWLTEAWSD